MGTEIKRCLIVSGAPEADIAYIKPLLPGAFVVAADSGYQKCRRLGAEPDIVVGDFDSSPVPEHTKELIDRHGARLYPPDSGGRYWQPL